jgi:hypothetical protein
MFHLKKEELILGILLLAWKRKEYIHCYKTGGEITLPRTDGDGPNCPWHGKRFLLVGKVNTSSSQCFSDNDEKFLPRVLPPD